MNIKHRLIVLIALVALGNCKPKSGSNRDLGKTSKETSNDSIPEDENPPEVDTKDDMGPNVSPDGELLAFYSFRNEDSDEPRIFVSNIDGTNMHQLIYSDTTGYHSEPIWSNDGKKIAYTNFGEKDSKMMVIPRNGGKAVELPGHPEGGMNLFACWDNLDEGYYFTHWVLENDEFKPNIFYRKGKTLKQITTDDISLRPKLDSDGALYYAVGTDFQNGKPDTYVLFPNKEKPVKLDTMDSWFPSFGTDHNVYAKGEDGKTVFYLEDLNGKNDQKILEVTGGPAQFMSMDKNERYLAYHIPGSIGNDVHVIDMKTMTRIQVTNDQ